MTDGNNSNKIHTGKTSLILALTVISYSAIATYLNVRHGIYLPEYTTPLLLGTVVIIISVAVVRRCFDLYVTSNKICFSFGRQKDSTRIEMCRPSDGCADKENAPRSAAVNTRQSVVNGDYTESYETRIAEIEREKANRQADVMRVIHEYTTFVMAEFLSKDDLAILHKNIECLALGQNHSYEPVRSKHDNTIGSIDLRHFAWNVGERLDISLTHRAEFISTIFPVELKNASVYYLSKNLRVSGSCKIPLDIPKPGDYHFKSEVSGN